MKSHMSLSIFELTTSTTFRIKRFLSRWAEGIRQKLFPGFGVVVGV